MRIEYLFNLLAGLFKNNLLVIVVEDAQVFNVVCVALLPVPRLVAHSGPARWLPDVHAVAPDAVALRQDRIPAEPAAAADGAQALGNTPVMSL